MTSNRRNLVFRYGFCSLLLTNVESLSSNIVCTASWLHRPWSAGERHRIQCRCTLVLSVGHQDKVALLARRHRVCMKWYQSRPPKAYPICMPSLSLSTSRQAIVKVHTYRLLVVETFFFWISTIPSQKQWLIIPSLVSCFALSQCPR